MMSATALAITVAATVVMAAFANPSEVSEPSGTRQYVLIRTTSTGGRVEQPSFGRDESLRDLGWPPGLSADVALVNSHPVLGHSNELVGPESGHNAVEDPHFETGDRNDNKGSSDNKRNNNNKNDDDDRDNDNEAGGVAVFHSDPLRDGRSGPTRVRIVSPDRASVADAERDPAETAAGALADVNTPRTTTNSTNDHYYHEGDSGNNRGHPGDEASLEDSSLENNGDVELEPINIEDIEKIMARHDIRILEPERPAVGGIPEKRYVEATASAGNQSVDTRAAASGRASPLVGGIVTQEANAEFRPAEAESSDRRSRPRIPAQVMRIAEWLLNQAP